MSPCFNFPISKLLNECNNNPELPKTFMSECFPQLIEKVSLFEKLARSEIEQSLVKRSYQNGQYLRQANMPTNSIWLIVCGVVIEEIEIEELNYVKEFHFCGELIGNYTSYRIKKNNVCGLKAIKKTECWEIPCEKIAQWKENYLLMEQIVDQLVDHSLYWQNNVIGHLKSLPADKAIAYLKTHFPKYKNCFSSVKLAQFISCSESTYKRYDNAIQQ
jgi:hypothetical protein